MKKIFIMAVLFLGMSIAAGAQQTKALGIRLGYGLEASYQHTVGNDNFIEANLGLFEGIKSINLVATYNISIMQPGWTSRGNWNLYAGPGLSFGFLFDRKIPTLAAVGQVGLEYSFWFPLQFSIDVRPQFGVELGDKVKFYGHGLYFGLIPVLGVRYTF